MQSISVFLDTIKIADFHWKSELKGVTRNLYILWIFFRQHITVASFLIVRYVWQILGRRGFFVPLPPPFLRPWPAPEKPNINKANGTTGVPKKKFSIICSKANTTFAWVCIIMVKRVICLLIEQKCLRRY